MKHKENRETTLKIRRVWRFEKIHGMGGTRRKIMRVCKSCQTLVWLLSFLFLASAQAASPSAAHKINPQTIDDFLMKSALKSASMSLQVASLPEGKILYQRYADVPMIPASNMKIVTMAAALRELGPLYTFRTEIYARAPAPKDGRLPEIWIKGYGDPFLTQESLRDIAHQLAVSGVKTVDGAVYLDQTYFDRNGLTTYLSGEDDLLHTIVTGTLPSGHSPKARVQKDDPDLETGRTLMRLMSLERITVTGPLRREAVPKDAFLLLTHRSPPFSEILKKLGKSSDNFIAEQLVKTIAAKHFGPPGALNRGLFLMRDYLKSLGIPESEFVLDNGSGLTRISKMTAAHFVKILFDMSVSPWKDEFREALAVSGTDGTLVRRFSPRLKGKVIAKTGTLRGVTALSGYVLDGKKQFAFSFLFNDFQASLSEATRIEDALLTLISDSL